MKGSTSPRRVPASPAGTPRLYFAYGSNLAPTQMEKRCPSSIPLGLARLRGWSWVINERGFANIVPSDALADEITRAGSAEARRRWGLPRDPMGEEVYGVLYRLHPNDEPLLDVCEGVPWAYQKLHIDVEVVSTPQQGSGSGSGSNHDDEEDEEDGGNSVLVEALIYVDRMRILPSEPRSEYVARMNRGISEARDKWGLPDKYVEKVMRPFIPWMG